VYLTYRPQTHANSLHIRNVVDLLQNVLLTVNKCSLQMLKHVLLTDPFSDGLYGFTISGLIGCWQNLGAVCSWQPIPSGLNLVVAVPRDSLCVVSLLSCVADCYMLYTVCKVEWFVLTIIKRRLLLLLLISLSVFFCFVSLLLALLFDSCDRLS